MQPGAFDVAVIGGAFAGSASALLLRRARPDLRVLIIEAKDRFDLKVGESAVELSSWFLTRVLRLDRHLAIEQLPKYGLRFWFQNESVRSLADCSELGNLYQTRVPSYHIDRARLDEHVQALAVSEGAVVWRPARLCSLDLREGMESALEVETERGRVRASARWIIDASGRRTWLARRLGLVEPMPEHPTHSVWARYRGVRDFDGGWIPGRDENRDATICSRGLSTNHFTGPGWWVWVIPLRGGEVSVGVVWDERLFGLPAGDSLAQRFEVFLRSFPAGRELMERAERLPDDLHALRHLPYRVRRTMGDGWALVGDAAGFIDPFYSPGLDWAALTIGGATAVILKSLAGGDAGADIASHNARYGRGFERWFEALYRDKYFYMGDAELMEVALRMDVPLYYYGVVTPPYRQGAAGLQVPFSLPVSEPFFRMMRFVNRRLARLARIRLAAGTWGRRNAGRRTLLRGVKIGPSSLRYLPGALARLAVLEVRSLPDRLAARRRPAPLADAAGAARA